MDVQHEIRVLPVDGEMAAKLSEWQKEGWELVPGIPPVCVYHVVRAKPRDGSAPEPASEALAASGPKVQPMVTNKAFGVIAVDDNKVGLIRDGKVISGA